MTSPDDKGQRAIVALLVSCGVQRALAELIAKWNTEGK